MKETNKKGRQQTGQNKKSKKTGKEKIVVRVQNTPSNDGSAERYASALIKPFSSRALGARVPDLYSYPTETISVETSYTVSTTAAGNLCFSINPSPLYTMLGINTVITGGNGTTQASYINSTNNIVGIAGCNYFGAVSSTALINRFSDYRVVGAGVQVKPLISYTNASGKIVYSMTPSAPSTSPYLVVSSGAIAPNDYNVAAAYGLPWDGGVSMISAAGLLTDPVSGEISMTELIQKTNLEASLKISSPVAFEFRNTNLNASGYIVAGDAVSASGFSVTGVTNTSIDETAVQTGGWSNFSLRGIGLQPSAAVLEVRVIFHLEGSPAVNTGTGISGASSKTVVKPMSFFNALERAANSPAFRLIASEAGAGVANYGMRALGILGAL